MSTPPKSARRGPYHHGNLPQALVEAGLRLLDEQGAGALTLRTVAKRVGVSHAAPYRHFASKAELLAALATASLTSLAEQLRDAAGRASGDPTAAADAAYLGYAANHPARYRILFEPPTPHAATAALRDARSALLAALGATSERAEAGAEWQGVDAVSSRWARLHGLASLRLGGWLDGAAAAATSRASSPTSKKKTGGT